MIQLVNIIHQWCCPNPGSLHFWLHNRLNSSIHGTSAMKSAVSKLEAVSLDKIGTLVCRLYFCYANAVATVCIPHHAAASRACRTEHDSTSTPDPRLRHTQGPHKQLAQAPLGVHTRSQTYLTSHITIREIKPIISDLIAVIVLLAWFTSYWACFAI